MIPILTLVALSSLAAPQDQPERPWTFMIYGAADNNADGPILDFLDGVRTAFDDDPGVELVLFLDRSEGFSEDSASLGADFTGARIYRLGKDTAERLEADLHFPGMSDEGEYEVDSADPRNLGAFIAFCKERFPARNYGLMIYSHADGCAMCPDEESGGEMSIPELTDQVGEEASVDFLALELCNMGGIEIGYQWRPGNGGFSADVLLAIPNAGPPLDWDRAFARIRSKGHEPAGAGPILDPATMTAADFGALVIEEGRRGREAMAARYPGEARRLGHEAAGCYDLNRAEAVKEALDAFAVALARGAGSKDTLEALRGPGSQGTVMNYVGDDFGARPYVDLFDLCARAAGCKELDEPARVAARAVCEATDAYVMASFGMKGFEGFEAGRNGVSVVFPDGDGEIAGPFGTARVWSRLGWYTPLAAEEEGRPYGRWAFLMDGATPDNGEIESWFELLDAWFDDTSADPGGSNGYVW